MLLLTITVAFLLAISNEISLNCSPALYVFRKHFSCQRGTPPSLSLVSFHLPPALPVFILPFHRQDHSITSWLNLDLYPFCRWQKPGLRCHLHRLVSERMAQAKCRLVENMSTAFPVCLQEREDQSRHLKEPLWGNKTLQLFLFIADLCCLK